MPKVVTFGEIMLRLSPPGFERFLQSPQFVATYGGGEANVAVSLAQFGLESHYVTRLPAHAIGEGAVRVAARGRGADGLHRPRRRAHRHLLRRDRRQPARLDGHLRPGAVRHQRDDDRDRGLGRGVRRCGVVSLDRHHAGARRARGSSDPGSARGRPRGGGGRQRRSQLPQEAVDRDDRPRRRCAR